MNDMYVKDAELETKCASNPDLVQGELLSATQCCGQPMWCQLTTVANRNTNLFVLMARSSEIVVETLERVPNKRQAHFRCLLNITYLLRRSLRLLGLE